MKRLWLALVVITLLSAGCGTQLATVSPVDVSVPTPVTVDSEPLFVSPVSVLPTPASEDMALIDGELSHLVEDDLGLARDSLHLVTVEARTWGDASLGCPQPGMAYAQILTEGWLVVFRGPDGQEIPVHTKAGMQHYVICSDEFQSLPPVGDDLSVIPVLRSAVSLLAETLGVPPDKVSVQGITQKQWNNSCLGCAEPKENCLMVITPGYQVQLTVDGREYTVHTNADGSAVRLCENPDDSPPGGE